MRYTTIIDITEFRRLYQSPSVRLVYLHLALRAGYHDDDRDLADVSVRQLAVQTGVTVSAARHALHVLEQSGLIRRQGRLWLVTKWVMSGEITPRARTKKQATLQEQAAARRRDEQRTEAARRENQEKNEQIYAQGKTPFMLYYEGLLTKAAAGDIEAKELVERHRKTYEQHKANMNQNKTK